jgi:hypothetical protein
VLVHVRVKSLAAAGGLRAIDALHGTCFILMQAVFSKYQGELK